MPREAGSFGPFGDGCGNPVLGDEQVVRSISALFFRRCPSAVARFVAARIVDTVNGVSRAGTRAHIRKEVLEGIAPAFAHGDAFGSVVVETGGSGPVAPSFHGAPDMEFRRASHSVTKPVALPQMANPLKMLRRSFCKLAAAGLNGSAAYCGERVDLGVSASASAKDETFLARRNSRKGFNGEPVVGVADQVGFWNSRCHSGALKLI